MNYSYEQVNDELRRIIPLIKISKTITPLNDNVEKKKFFNAYSKRQVYNPQYQYSKMPRSVLEAKRRLFRIRDFVLDKKQDDLVKKLLLMIEFLESVGEDKKQIFTNGRPDPQMVAVAKMTFPQEKMAKSLRKVTAKEARKAFLEHLSLYDIKDWKIKIRKDMIAKANVEASKKTVHIKDRNYSHHEINNLIAHEIDVHVLRAVNGKKNKDVLFSLGTADYLKTEEGLAIMMEQLTGNYNPLRFKFFAARVIAADLAVTKGFHDVFQTLHKRFKVSKHNAYIITKRVKRGLVDTSKAGGYIKDHVYFEGFYMIKKFMQSGGDIRPLFAGKIALTDLNLVKNENLKNLIIPKAVEAHYQYRSRQMVLY